MGGERKLGLVYRMIERREDVGASRVDTRFSEPEPELVTMNLWFI